MQQVINCLVKVGKTSPTQETSVPRQHEANICSHGTVVMSVLMFHMGMQGNTRTHIY
jgi:hypothetical protein